MRIEEKLWDSEVLGVRCGKVYCDAYDKSVAFDDWDFLHARVEVGETDCAATLEKSGFQKVSTYLLLNRDLRAYPPVVSSIDFPYREATENDAEFVGGLAAQILSHDRLHADRRVPWKIAKARKRAWGKGLCGDYADCVFVATDLHYGVIGFSSVYLGVEGFFRGRGDFIGLNGVHPTFRGRGIGSGLVELACKHLVNLGRDYVLTSTQRSNMPALNMYYKKCHFKIQEMAHDFHWIRPGLEW